MDTTIQFYDSFGEAFESHTRMAEEIERLMRDANSEMGQTCERRDVIRVNDVQEARRWLRSLDTATSQYINEVNEVIARLQRDKDRVIEDLRRNSFTSFQSLTNDLKRGLEECERIYQTIREYIRSFTESCSRAEAICHLRFTITDNTKVMEVTTRVVATGAVAVGGIAASIFVGIFTFGIGTVIGIPLTLAATAATATTTATAGAPVLVTPNFFSEAAGSFRRMRNKFECLDKTIRKVDDWLLQSRDNLSSVQMSILEQERLVNCVRRAAEYANRRQNMLI